MLLPVITLQHLLSMLYTYAIVYSIHPLSFYTPLTTPHTLQVLQELGAYLLVVSLLVFLLMYSEYQLVQLTSSLTLSVAGILKVSTLVSQDET